VTGRASLVPGGDARQPSPQPATSGRRGRRGTNPGTPRSRCREAARAITAPVQVRSCIQTMHATAAPADSSSESVSSADLLHPHLVNFGPIWTRSRQCHGILSTIDARSPRGPGSSSSGVA
jgi:hypothetical protein